jgi:hypothetical protein
LTGAPYKIFKNTAFIKDMFNSALEVAKFEGANIRALLNMSLIKAVFLKILYGAPVNLSFLTILVVLSMSRITPVAEIRKLDTALDP